MTAATPAEYTLASLEEVSGTSARTIRYYISQGLIPGPSTLGRGAVYGADHLDRLKKIALWKAEGLTLGEIKTRLEGREDRPPWPQAQQWEVLNLTEDVALFLRVGLSPARRRVIHQALVPFLAAVATTQGSSTSEEG